jgi:hypothetical protein
MRIELNDFRAILCAVPDGVDDLMALKFSVIIIFQGGALNVSMLERCVRDGYGSKLKANIEAFLIVD